MSLDVYHGRRVYRLRSGEGIADLRPAHAPPPFDPRDNPSMYLGGKVCRIPTHSASERAAQLVRAVVWVLTLGRSGKWPWVRVHGPAQEYLLEIGEWRP